MKIIRQIHSPLVERLAARRRRLRSKPDSTATKKRGCGDRRRRHRERKGFGCPLRTRCIPVAPAVASPLRLQRPMQHPAAVARCTSLLGSALQRAGGEAATPRNLGCFRLVQALAAQLFSGAILQRAMNGGSNVRREPPEEAFAFDMGFGRDNVGLCAVERRTSTVCEAARFWGDTWRRPRDFRLFAVASASATLRTGCPSSPARAKCHWTGGYTYRPEGVSDE